MDGRSKYGRVRCQVAIIGAQRVRVSKVASLVASSPNIFEIGRDEQDGGGEDTVSVKRLGGDIDSSSRNDAVGSAPGAMDPHVPGNLEGTSGTVRCSVDFLPCVASFGSYTNEAGGEPVRYLASVEYHGRDGKQAKGSSLAPFFDRRVSADLSDDDEGDGDDDVGIIGVAVGCGIESPEEVAMIKQFVQSLNSDPDKRPLSVECLGPSCGFQSMKQENEEFKAMSAEEKGSLLFTGSHIGPGKMAMFAVEVAERAVRQMFANTGTSADKNGVVNSCEQKQEHGSVGVDHVPPRSLGRNDGTKPRFACKRCRTVLFGEDEIENPPHRKSMHSFSLQKVRSQSSDNFEKPCQSVFLSGALDWMGDTGAFEGKLNCPKCRAKVGQWNWSGAQCSCGTWVTPAVQFPLSKIDRMVPLQHSVNISGTV